MDDLLRPRTDLHESRVSSEKVFDGELLHVRRDMARLPNGHASVREYIEHPGAVAVVAITDTGEIVLERQFRYPFGRVFIELPAGKIDPGEDDLTCGKRELLEETGYVAQHWRHLFTFNPLVAYTTERIELFEARGLKMERPRLDANEFLEVFTAPIPAAIEWVRAGKITDAKTMLALLWLGQFG